MPELRRHGKDRARHRRRLIGKILAAGLAGAAASAAAAALASRHRNGHAARPMNAIVHIYDGGEPPAHDGRRSRNTMLGLAIHTAASLWWAAFYEAALRLQRRPRRLMTGLAVSGLAYGVDYYLVSRRFQPGFERYLSASEMLGVYAALALGYALSGRRRPPVRERQHERERAAFAGPAREPQLAAQEPRQLAADR